MLTKSRTEFCNALSKCIWDEVKLTTNIQYTGEHLFIQIAYINFLLSKAVDDFKKYLEENFDLYLKNLSSDYYETKAVKNLKYRVLVYNVMEKDIETIEMLLKLKNY